MGELFGVAAESEISLSLRFREGPGPRGYREEGWGVGAMQGRAALLLKEPASRPDPATARMLSEGRAIRGEGAIAYIRRWTRSASLGNCHPFVRELGGREWVFAHNGSLPGLLRDPLLVPERFRPVGSTDSEYAFCVLLERLAQAPPLPMGEAGECAATSLARRLVSALRPVSRAIARHGMFNYLLLTERCLVAFSSGEYGLYLLALPSVDPPLTLRDEDWEIAVGAPGPFGACAVAASNPMGPQDWRRLAPGEMALVVSGRPVAGTVSPSGARSPGN